MSMTWDAFIESLFRLAAPYLETRGDMPHARVSHGAARALLVKEGGDPKIVEPAVILHDVGWSRLTPEEIRIAFGVRSGGEEAERLNRIHEVEGAAIAGRLLEALDYPPERIAQISEIIARHDSGKHVASLEESIVKDADKLWRFSAFGFWKEVERQGLTQEELYRFLLARYHGWFFTRSAVKMAEDELRSRGSEPPPPHGGNPGTD